MLTSTSAGGKAIELQVQIDDVYACLGQCAGCVLAPEERKNKQADMSPETMRLAVDRLVEHATFLRPLKRVNVTFAIADHLLMGKDYLVNIHKLGSEIVRAGAPDTMEHSGVFFTTSLVGKPARVMQMLSEVRSEIDSDVPFIPLVVLDGKVVNASKFGSAWREMVLFAKELFGKVDLNTNLSVEAIGLMSPTELMEFAVNNGFDDVTVNWTPTLKNHHATTTAKREMANWLLNFDELVRARGDITTGYGQYIDRVVENAISSRGLDGASDLVNYVNAVVPETILKSVEIDHEGYLFPKFEAVGDIPQSPRHGLKGVGHIGEGSIRTLLENNQKTIFSQVIKQHSRGSCVRCEYNAVCAVTGFHISTAVCRSAGLPDGQCPHVAKDLFNAAYARAGLVRQ